MRCLLLTFVFWGFLCCMSQNCFGPLISYSNGKFTINGPCPNESVLVASVGSVVELNCSYTAKIDGNQFYFPYWSIAGLVGTPFVFPIDKENITVLNMFLTSGASGSTTLFFLVEEQYLDRPLDIQCGICSVPTDCANQPLYQGLLSSTARLFAFGEPRSLHFVIKGDAVKMSWSAPQSSDDYENNSIIQFNYKIVLSNVITLSQVASYTTSETTVSITQANISQNSENLCSSYSWSVNAFVEKRSSIPVKDNRTFSFPSVPVIQESFATAVIMCQGILYIRVSPTITTCDEVDDLEFNILVNQEARSIIEINSAKVFTDNFTYTIDILFMETHFGNLEEESSELLSNMVVVINVSDAYGYSVTANETIENMMVSACQTSSIEYLKFSTEAVETIKQTVSPQTSPPSQVYSTTTVPTTESSPQSNNHLLIGLLPAMFLSLLLILVVSTLLIIYKMKRKTYFQPAEQAASSISNDHELENKQSYARTTPASDYQTPYEAIEAKEAYQSHVSTLHYSEPQLLKSPSVPITPLPQQESLSLNHTLPHEVQELPGYSEVHGQHNGSARNRSRKISTRERKETDHKSTDTTTTYVDVRDIIVNKSARNDSYAKLHLPPPTGSPPPVPCHTTTVYSTIMKEIDNTSLDLSQSSMDEHL